MLFISQNSSFAALKFSITLPVHQKPKTLLFSLSKTVFIFLWCLSFSLRQYAQTDTNQVLNFNFNNHQIKEAADKIAIKPEGISLTDDRFGNKQSAIYLHGHAASYLNLGTSNLLKPKNGTISLWANLDRRVYTGKGYDSNPLIVTKNGPGDDFIIAYCIIYDCSSKRFVGCATKDSTKEAFICSTDEAKFGKWYHLVITYDNNFFALYVNGKLQQKYAKGFETQFLKTDSVIIGNNASKKNDRWSQGTVDDIQIFNRVLNEKEIEELYEAPNPNRTQLILNYVLAVVGLVFLIVLVAYLIVARHRKSLAKEEEKFKLNSKLHELEIKVIKAQMNPHFMFNSLNSIQLFILTNENEKAQYYLSKFSKLVRKLLESTTKENISLSEEIEILNGYLELESLRFNNVFNYTITIGEGIDAAETFIPHFLVQPFIENAIWHGLLAKEGDKHLNISFKLINEFKIACTIDDNGVGRNKSEEKKNLEKKSLAINFIQQRLDLINKMDGLDFKMDIIDKTDADGNSTGTTVIITLPLIKKT
jgi:hypothetical protein